MKFIILTIFFAIIDLISKLVIEQKILLNQTISIIENFFNLTYIRNYGAAWGSFQGYTILLILVSLSIIVYCIYTVYKKPTIDKLSKISYSLIIGGALGNLYDRLTLGYVRDFLDFQIFNYNFPVFNLADTFVVIGVILLFIIELTTTKNNNHSKKF